MSTRTNVEQAKLRVGSVVADKYRLLRLLGAGGMGAVYEAEHFFTERRVALKLLHAWTAAKSPSASARFLQEAKTSAIVRHPGIVDVLDAGYDSDGTIYLVFEMLEGEDLGAAVEGGRLSLELLLRVVGDVLGALGAAHARGLVHRDIKPPNIFLAHGADGVISGKLLDFGIAQRAREQGGVELTQAGMVVGTMFFMSPEQMGRGVLDGRSDLWSLGVVMFYALAGRLPFSAQAPLALMSELVQRGARSLREYRADLPDRVIEVVDRALRTKPEMRFRNAEEMARALAPAPPSPEKEERPRSRVVAPAKPREAWEQALADIEEENRILRAKKKP